MSPLQNYHFQDTSVEKGQTYSIVSIRFTAKDENGLDCGGTVTMAGGISSEITSREITSQEVPNTGVSIPVAIIGIGSLVGLTVYAVTTRKLKMHRI